MHRVFEWAGRMGSRSAILLNETSPLHRRLLPEDLERIIHRLDVCGELVVPLPPLGVVIPNAPQGNDGAVFAAGRKAPSRISCAAPPPAEQPPQPTAGPEAARPDNLAPPGPTPARPLPHLPERDARLFAVHYAQEKIENSVAQTPPVSAIVVQHVLTQDQRTFAAFKIAEAGGITPSEFPARLYELEGQLLREFFDFVAAHPEAVWLNWNMRGPLFGFEVLAQRARLHGLSPDNVPLERRFNLAGYLKVRFGDNYAPHPRLWHAIHQNGVNRPGLLNEEQAAAAWEKGEYAALLQSLSCKVDAIADLFDRVNDGIFLACAPEPAAESSCPLPAPSATAQAAAPPCQQEPARPPGGMADGGAGVPLTFSPGALVYGNRRFPLTGKRLEVLRALAEAPERTRTAGELLKAVWGDVAVEEDTVRSAVSGARKALRAAMQAAGVAPPADPIPVVDRGTGRLAWRLDLP
jgi:hypothetical protein